MMKTSLLLSTTLVIASYTQAVSGQCTICKNAEPVSEPDNILSLPGFPPLQCGTVDTTLAFLVPNKTSPDCETVQSLGSLCGCSVRSDFCPLCSDGRIASLPDNELPFLADLFLGYTPTCRILEAYLAAQSKEESICFIGQSFISDYCGCNDALPKGGCSLCSGGEASSIPDKAITIPDFPFRTCGQLEEALDTLLSDGSEQCSLLSQAFASYCGCSSVRQDSCSLCRDGSPVPLPNQTAELLKDEFGGIVPTCAVYESFVAGIEDGSDDCSTAQYFASVCGCPPVDDHCVFCPGETIQNGYVNKEVHELDLVLGFTMTCGDIVGYLQYQVPDSHDMCRFGQGYSHVCGCNDGLFSYLSADTRAKQAAFAWVPRMAAFCSLIGSILIMRDILSSPKKRKALYSQLIFGMSIFDLIGAIAWGFASLPIPEYNGNGDPTYVYGAIGNEATCKLQGFLVQLNFTSIFYNISLSTYYLLVIVHSWRDTKLKRIRWWLHGIPLAIGMSLAFGGLPFYQNTIVICHIQNPPVFEETWFPSVFFVFVPIFATLFFTTVMMSRVYIKVRRQTQRASRWQFDQTLSFRRRQAIQNRGEGRRRFFWGSRQTPVTTSGQSQVGMVSSSAELARRRPRRQSATSRLEVQVFVQAALFLSAFYISWIFLLGAYMTASPMIDANDRNLFWFYLTCFSLAPLQGFWNCCVYFRPRLVERARQRRIRAARRENVTEASSTQGSSSFPFKNVMRRGSTNAGQGCESGTANDGTGSLEDPSVAIANWKSQSSSNPNLVVGEDESELDAIREELAQLDDADLKIEEYKSDDHDQPQYAVY